MKRAVGLGWHGIVASTFAIWAFGVMHPCQSQPAEPSARTQPERNSETRGWLGLFGHPSVTPTELARRLDGKRVIEMGPVEGVSILLPNQQSFYFGVNFRERLIDHLQRSGRFIISESSSVRRPKSQSVAARPAAIDEDEVQWEASITPAASVRFKLEELSFTTGGDAGDRLFYGFAPNFTNSFNCGAQSQLIDEFPLGNRQVPATYFAPAFTGSFLSSLGEGLETGISIDAVIASAHLLLARYRSAIQLRMILRPNDLNSTEREQSLRVTGKGFYTEVAGSYKGLSVAITAGRSDAMGQAMDHLIEASQSQIAEQLGQLPLLAALDVIVSPQEVLLGTGFRSEIALGTQYELVETLPQTDSLLMRLEVVQQLNEGMRARVLHGFANESLLGSRWRQTAATLPVDSAAHNAPSSGARSGSERPLSPAMQILELEERRLEPASPAVRGGLLTAALLPVELIHYFRENPAFDHGTYVDQIQNHLVHAQPWSQQVGLNVDAPSLNAGMDVTVAIVDSGVGYNHPILHSRIWLNPEPWTHSGVMPDLHGWDFSSNDDRPYDEGEHGTQLASLVGAVAPQARIMPIRVFDRWGKTSSAALYAGFQYAVDHGAQIILAGWATSVDSRAIRQAVKYAADHEVAVVAAAGDTGVNLENQPHYPVSLSLNYPTVLGVTSVGQHDALAGAQKELPNYGPQSVQIAAPGQHIRVASKSGGYAHGHLTGHAAALVAGALARTGALGGTPLQWIHTVLARAQTIVGLEGEVKGGKRLAF